MTPLPLVTCGITAFNAAASIERAVGSALGQNWRPIEIVVVDDGSEDNTQPILAELAEKHPGIRVFRMEKNSGVAAARNRILAEARGEFIAFFDDDDESLADRVERQIKRIIDYEREFASGRPVICHAARRTTYPDGSERIEHTMGEAEGELAPSGPAVARRVLMGTPLKNGYGACATCSQCARLSTYRLVGGFDPAFRRGEDTDFNIRLAMMGGHFVGSGEPLVKQTMTPTSDKSLLMEYDALLRIIEKHRDFLAADGQYDFSRSWVGAKYAWLQRRHADFAVGLLSLALTHPALTFRRLWQATPNFGLNLAFRRFHSVRPE